MGRVRKLGSISFSSPRLSENVDIRIRPAFATKFGSSKVALVLFRLEDDTLAFSAPFLVRSACLVSSQSTSQRGITSLYGILLYDLVRCIED